MFNALINSVKENAASPWWGNAMVASWAFLGFVVLALIIIVAIIQWRNRK